MLRAILGMRAGQVAQAHQELAGDLAAGEAERLLEQLHPVGLAARVMRVQPRGEAAMAGPQLLDHLRVVDGGQHLQTVADDAGVGQQALDVLLGIGRHAVHVEAIVGRAEALALLQDGFPAQPGLVDFQHQPLEQLALVALREAVFIGVVELMHRVARGDAAVSGQGVLLAGGRPIMRGVQAPEAPTG